MKKTLLSLISASVLFAVNVDYLTQIANSNPNNIESRIELGKYYYQSGDYQKAKKYFLEVIKLDSNNKTAIYYLKNIYKKTHLQQIFKEMYTNDYNKIVDTLFKTENYDKLIFFYKLIDNINLLSDASLIKIAKAYMIKKEYKKSLEVLSHIREKNSDYYILMAYNYYYLKDYKNAMPYFEILYSNTQNPEYGYKLLYIYSITKEANKFKNLYLSMKAKGINVSYYDKTYKYFTSQYKPKSYNMNEIYAYLRANKIEEAKNRLKYINTPEAKIILADIYLNLNQYKKSITLFKEVSINGNEKQKYIAKKALANIYMQLGDFDTAKSILLSLKAQYPNDQYIKEDLLLANKEFNILINRYKNYLYENPNSSYYLLRLAYIYKLKGDFTKAIIYYQKAMNITPNNPNIYRNLGELYLKQGNYKAGFRYLNMWTKINNAKEAKLELAKYYYKYGFISQAKSILNYLIQQYPNYQEAKILLNKLSSQSTTVSQTNNQNLPPLIDKFINAWKNAWESRDIEVYSLFYDNEHFSNRWKRKKRYIFNRSKYIKVTIIDPKIIYHKGNIYKVKFFQIYKNNYHQDKGYKTLTLKCNRNFCQIIDEKWRRGTYKKIASSNKTIPALNKLKSLEEYLDSSLNRYADGIKEANFNPQKIITTANTPIIKPKITTPTPKEKIKKDDIDLKLILEDKTPNFSTIKNKVTKKVDKFKEYIINKNSKQEALVLKQELNLVTIPYIKKEKEIQTILESKYSSSSDNVDSFDYRLTGMYEGFRGFIGQFYLSEKNEDVANYYFGAGYKNLNYLAEILYDNSTGNIGFNLALFGNNYELSIERKNLIFERESAYASLLTDNIFKVSVFKKFNKQIDLQAQVKYESISDNNSALTTKAKLNLYKIKEKRNNFSFNINGWYTFTSTTTEYYYSESKADKTLVGAEYKTILPYKILLKANANLGYSVHASSVIYEGDLFIYHTEKSLQYYIGVSYSMLPIIDDTISKGEIKLEVEKEF